MPSSLVFIKVNEKCAALVFGAVDRDLAAHRLDLVLDHEQSDATTLRMPVECFSEFEHVVTITCEIDPEAIVPYFKDQVPLIVVVRFETNLRNAGGMK